MRRRLFVISNPGAGLSHSSLIDDTVRALERAGANLTRVRPQSIAAARQAARAAAASGSYEAIVAAGGDGTIRHVASALIDSDAPLGIIPVGTGNVLAHEIGLEATAQAITRTLLDGPAVRVACAHANGEPFLLMAGAGFDARILIDLNQRAKSLLGKVAYAAPLTGALLRPLDTLHVTVDGRTCQASWAVITNSCHYGGGFVLSKRTNIHARGLEAILFKARTRAALASMLMSLARGRLAAHIAHDEVEMLPCTRVRITAGTPIPVQIDGDVVGTTPLAIDAGSSHLHLIVPPSHVPA
ncbi:MAG TPA: diacylglycerol kinase family protein [Hyphomicrobiaceae bacterium]|nr:diacylglycerol kinase family protein [Hyphomicrobiaceae bacterium]